MIFYPLFRHLNTLKSKFIRLSSTAFAPDIDTNYYCNTENATEIGNNIKLRKGVGDIKMVMEMYKVLKATPITDASYETVRDKLYKELSCLPNKTHPSVLTNLEPHVVREINQKRDFQEHTPLEFSDITRRLNLVRTDKLGNTCGHKSYYFLGELAELEEALIKYTLNKLLQENFKLVSVPDILPSQVLKSCGMMVNNDRTQVDIHFSKYPICVCVHTY